MRIERKKAVGIVIDIQEKLVPVMDESEHLLRNCEILLKGLRVLDIPIYVTQQYTKGLGNTVPEIEKVVDDTIYIEKLAFSAYKSIEKFIKGSKFVIICGIEAHICILQTILDLKENGYIPVLVTDCISSRKKMDKKTAIKRTVIEGGLVTTYESLLFELLEVAGTDESKKIQQLIR